ncbi:multiple inositol polyphosphate phosphatase 1-like [Bradysia coprophila]|uniref:multiple inositol polyphosphate phosphatase 1-like n=1 Tax=Bradysia coprophila TaxID=38358 RepID=UPI00187DB728|nr:multiple inositol polyphosphate phosphatase 1-like [Bradysia coprophila]
MLSILRLFVLSLAFISTQGGVSVHNPFYCYSEDPVRTWTGLGGINSPYEPNRGQFINANVSTCNPSKIWMSGRHGSRFPFEGDLPNLRSELPVLQRQILTNYNEGRTSLCASDFDLIRNWQFNPDITEENAEHLSPSGWNEMKEMAQRFQAAFPTVLPSTYSPNDYFFQNSNFERTRSSLNAFADGLFGDGGHEQVQFEDIPEPDLHLRPFNHCPLYTDLNLAVEQDAFVEGPEYQEMVMQVSAKLGFHNSNVLRHSDIVLLALQCKYDQMWNLNYTSPSPFCASFSVANGQVVEYYQDLYWYHIIGYGQPEHRRLFENVMCFTLQDMLRFVRSNDARDHKLRIFNGHVRQFLMFLHFDAFDGDNVLTRHNFAQQSQRVWRSTELLPMAMNIAVVRYDCDDGDNDLLFLFNEKPLQIRGCDSNGVCKQSFILERLGRYLDVNCLEVFCTYD